MSLASLFPHLAGLRLEQVTFDGEAVRLHLAASARFARCPLCTRRSKRVHSIYHRTIADLPLAGRQVILHLRVRRFRCGARRCPRAIFAERFPTLVAAYGRRTLGQRAALEAIAFALGGSAGARLATRLGSLISRATLLRVLRRADVPARPAPQVLGIDDWAFRKGHRYGTILVDLERRRIVDLLEDRKAETLAPWLRQCPDLEVISRDRAPAYAEAARKGAPQAVQVVDRRHLLQNLVEALERCLLRLRPALKAAAGLGEAILGPLPGSTEATLVPWQQRAEAASQQKHASKVERYEQMRTLRAAGFTVLDIAQIVGATRRTVYRYLALGEPPERRRPQRSKHRVLAPYEAYLQQRWAEGCRNRSRLFREIRLLGYQHSARTVSLFLRRLNEQPSMPEAPSPRPTVTRTPSARHVACLLVWRKDRLPEEERDYLRRLCDQEPTVALAYELAQEFATMARGRTGQGFDAWLTRATTSGISELGRFARGLTDDRAAVEAGLSQEWSNGQSEGQVNKLKLLKRQMYGRAKFDLLRRRVLHAA
ncbi:MAG: ISL3 family transposase [Chloroflexota bacterium]|nr:ISL3 family transposase [Chloroflexota bacterium]